MDKEDIRVGRVSAVNYEAGTISVVYEDRDGSVTKDIPMLSHEYMMPEMMVPQMGNQCYTVKLKTEQEVHEFIKFVTERR